MAMTPFGYRPELDGLRTLAVYLVVAYHSGVSLFRNGYLGVDVFFVLSGFLVTNVLINELSERKEIRFRRFFARRIRRLLPAGLATILATLIALRFVASPAERAAVESDATAAALWFANFHAVDRIRAGIENPSPLLHFWSLSIEEQYYVVFPAVVFGLWILQRRGFAAMWGLLAAGAVAGAALQIILNQSDPTAAYYHTQLRIYQMLSGAALGSVLRRRPSLIPQLPRGAAMAALAGVAALSLDLAPSLSPSSRGVFTTLLVVVCLLGLMRGDSSASATLSTRPMVYLGGLSYAVYLFHVPIGVITDYAVGDMSPWSKFVYTALAATLLAALSARILEQPIRVNARLDLMPGRVIVVGLASSVVTGVALVPLLV